MRVYFMVCFNSFIKAIAPRESTEQLGLVLVSCDTACLQFARWSWRVRSASL